MIRFLVDAQLPPALARWLSDRGYPSEHVFDFGGDGTSDLEIWDRALGSGSVILSKDEDFSMRALRSKQAPRIVWIRIGNTRRNELMRWFEGLLPELLVAIERGERIIEIGEK